MTSVPQTVFVTLALGVALAACGCGQPHRGVAQEEPTGTKGQRAFFGIPTDDARTLVFVSDTCGSMTGMIDLVKYELSQTVYGLRPCQRFCVLFMSSGSPQEMEPRGPIPATRENKRLAAQFIESVVSHGQTWLGPSLRRALEMKPEVVYIITDAAIDRELVDQARAWNPGRRTRIHCIRWLWKEYQDVLRQIAADSGGQFRFVSDADLEQLLD